MNKIPLWLIILLLFLTNQVFAQSKETGERKDKKKTTTNVEFGFGYHEAMLYSFFNPQNSKEKTINGYYLLALLDRSSNNQIRSDFYLVRDNPKFLAFSISGTTPILSARVVGVEAHTYYSFYKNSEVLLVNKSLEIRGQTNKQYGLVSFSGGLGSYKKTNFRILFLAGGTYIHNELVIKIDKKKLNPNNTLFGEDHLFILGPGASVSIVPFSKVILQVNGKYLYSMANEQIIMPNRQLFLEGEAKIFPLKKLGIFAKGSYIDNPSGVHFSSKNIVIGILFKF